jgi:hypothetical protein
VGLSPTGGAGASGSSAVASGVAKDAKVELEFWFESADDQTRPAKLLLVEPPAVVAATATITPPAYVGGAAASQTALKGAARGAVLTRQDVELGAGSDERAATPPILQGSRVRLNIAFNKALPVPTWEDRAEWIRTTLGSELAAVVEKREGRRRRQGGFGGRVSSSSTRGTR